MEKDKNRVIRNKVSFRDTAEEYFNTLKTEIKRLNISDIEARLQYLEKENLELKRQVDKLWDYNARSFRIRKTHHELNTKRDCNKHEPKLREDALNLEESFLKLKEMVPGTYKTWFKLFEAGRKEYYNRPRLNLMTEGNGYLQENEDFKTFLNWYYEELSGGYLLDIGCGPQAVPTYLKGGGYSN